MVLMILVSLCSGFVSSSYPLTVVRQSALANIYLSLTVGLQAWLRKLYGIEEGQRVAVQFLTCVTAFRYQESLPEPAATPEPVKTTELIFTSPS